MSKIILLILLIFLNNFYQIYIYIEDIEKEKRKLQTYMASNGITDNPEEYLQVFPEIGTQRRKIMENGIRDHYDEDEKLDEVDMCKESYIYIFTFIKKKKYII